MQCWLAWWLVQSDGRGEGLWHYRGRSPGNNGRSAMQPEPSRYINSVSDLYGTDEIEFLLDDIRDLEPANCNPEDIQVNTYKPSHPNLFKVNITELYCNTNLSNVCTFVVKNTYYYFSLHDTNNFSFFLQVPFFI